MSILSCSWWWSKYRCFAGWQTTYEHVKKFFRETFTTYCTAINMIEKTFPFSIKMNLTSSYVTKTCVIDYVFNINVCGSNVWDHRPVRSPQKSNAFNRLLMCMGFRQFFSSDSRKIRLHLYMLNSTSLSAWNLEVDRE